MIKFSIDWKRHGKERHRSRIIFPGRDQMLADLHRGNVPKCFVSTYNSKKEKAFEAELVALTKPHAPDELISTPIILSVALEVEPIKSLSRPHREACLKNIIPPAKKPDLDNCIKFIKDVFNGLFWVDDSLVVREHISATYSERDKLHIAIETWDNLLTAEELVIFKKYWTK